MTDSDDIPAQPEAASAPVRILASGGERAPVIFDSPHSGRLYPGEFQPLVPLPELYGFEDRLVDTLIEPAWKHGISVLSAQFPRAYIDANRSQDDLEPEITGPDWPGVAQPVYATRGIGLIFRNALSGTPLYERPLDPEEIDCRIHRYWRPYHDALQDLMDVTARDWGAAWHVNWHSMRPVGDDLSSDPGAIRPDFVVSDLDGTSAEARFVDLVEGGLRRLGYTTARNQPFKGGYITRRHGRPAEGRHSIQVEINRALYLDLETLEATAGAVRLRADLDLLAADIAAYARAQAPLTPG